MKPVFFVLLAVAWPVSAAEPNPLLLAESGPDCGTSCQGLHRPAGSSPEAAPPAEGKATPEAAVGMGMGRGMGKGMMGTRDPSAMSPRFRRSIEGFIPRSMGGGKSDEAAEMPKIRLAGKSLGGARGAYAMLQIENRPPFLVQAGGQFTLPSESGGSLTVRVEVINEAGVKLLVLPSNKPIFLY